MKNRIIMKRIAILITSIIVLLSISCEREKDLTFSAFDKDNNGTIERAEFQEVFTANFYDDWNQNDDEYLDDEDCYLSVYEIWDIDNDNLLSEDEWYLGYDYNYGDYIITDYDAIDIDGDGFIEYSEYTGILDDSDLYLEWDIDASKYLTDKELANGVFNQWDLDKDNKLYQRCTKGCG